MIKEKEKGDQQVLGEEQRSFVLTEHPENQSKRKTEAHSWWVGGGRPPEAFPVEDLEALVTRVG